MPDPVGPRDAAYTRPSDVAPAAQEQHVPDLADEEVDAETVLAIFGGAKRTGEWTPPELLHTIAIMGGVEIDFRRALLVPGPTEVRVFALMGGVTITIPRGVDAEVTATAVFGGVDQKPLGNARQNEPVDEPDGDRGAGPSAAPRPLILITGVVVMGGIDILIA